MRKPLFIFPVFASLLFDCCSAPVHFNDYAVFHGNETHNGVYNGTPHNGFGKLKWKFVTNGKVFSSPAIVNGTAYFGSEDSCLYAVNILTGQLKWKFQTKGAVPSSPAVYKDVVYFCSYDGHCYAVSAGSGKEIWRFQTQGEKKVGGYGLWTMKPANLYMEDLYDFFLSSPVVDMSKDPSVYFGSSDGYIYSIDATTGKERWKFKTNGSIHTSPALYDHTVYVTSWDTYLYAIDAASGKAKWKFKTNEQPVYHLLEGIQAAPAVDDGTVYFGARDGYFYAVSATDGTLIWKYSNNGSWVLTTAAIYDGSVYFGTSDTYLLLALNAKSGKEKYAIKANGYIYSSPVVSGNVIYFGDFTGKIFAVDATSNGTSVRSFSTKSREANAAAILKKDTLDFAYAAGNADPYYYATGVKVMKMFYTLGPIVSSPCISGNTIFFGSADSCLYAIQLKN